MKRRVLFAGAATLALGLGATPAMAGNNAATSRPPLKQKPAPVARRCVGNSSGKYTAYPA